MTIQEMLEPQQKGLKQHFGFCRTRRMEFYISVGRSYTLLSFNFLAQESEIVKQGCCLCIPWRLRYNTMELIYDPSLPRRTLRAVTWEQNDVKTLFSIPFHVPARVASFCFSREHRLRYLLSTSLCSCISLIFDVFFTNILPACFGALVELVIPQHHMANSSFWMEHTGAIKRDKGQALCY